MDTRELTVPGSESIYLMETLRLVRSHFALLVMVAVFGSLLGFVAARSTNRRCDFGSIYIPPRLLQTPTGDADWVIEARVDSRGRVSDYRIISNADGLTDLSPQIKGSLIFTTFQPATYMGRPISATAILTFPKVSSAKP